MSRGINPDGIIELDIGATEVNKDERGSDPKRGDEPREYIMMQKYQLDVLSKQNKENVMLNDCLHDCCT